MSSQMLHDRGRGPEIVGTRITVYNLLPHFLDATATEGYICQLYGLTAEQVAAARAFILNHPESILAEHLKIETRLSAGNAPEVVNKAQQTRASFLRFKQWLEDRRQAEATDDKSMPALEERPRRSPPFPSFHEWVAQQQSRPVEGP